MKTSTSTAPTRRCRSTGVLTTVVLALWFTFAALLVSGCVRVPPWQRGVHADRRMKWSRCEARAGARQHTFAVREGASGGASGGGGACGCD